MGVIVPTLKKGKYIIKDEKNHVHMFLSYHIYRTSRLVLLKNGISYFCCKHLKNDEKKKNV